MTDRTTAEALRAFEHAQESDDSVDHALESLREVSAESEWDFEAMPDVHTPR